MRGLYSNALSAVVGLLVVAAGAVAAPPTIEVPAEVKPVGEYVRFTPKGEIASVVYVGLSGIDAFPSEELKDPRRFLLNVRGLPAGRYLFAAVASSKDGEQARADFAVVVGDGTKPPDPPGPGPTPPVDPFVASLKAAALADGWKAKLPDLAIRFSVAASRVDGRETVGDLMNAAAAAMAGDKTPPAVRAVLNPELKALDAVLPPSQPEKPVTDADRQRVKALFLRLAAVCSEAAK